MLISKQIGVHSSRYESRSFVSRRIRKTGFLLWNLCYTKQILIIDAWILRKYSFFYQRHFNDIYCVLVVEIPLLAECSLLTASTELFKYV